MNRRPILTLMMFAMVLNGCSGGGSGGAAATPPLPLATVHDATGTLTIDRPATRAASSARKPAYVSASTTYASLWIDSSVTAVRVPCSPAQCTINWTSTVGTHTFAVAIDDSHSISGGGNVLADNSETVTLNAGVNTIPNLTLNGVAAELTFVSQTSYPAGDPTCTNSETSQNNGLNCFIVLADFDDADGNIISNTTTGTSGQFDNEGVCAGPTTGVFYGRFYLANVGSGCYSTIGDVAATNGLDTVFMSTCTLSQSTAFTFNVTAFDGTAGDTNLQLGEVSPQQLSTYSLVYPTQYPYAVLNFPTYTCSASRTIS